MNALAHEGLRTGLSGEAATIAFGRHLARALPSSGAFSIALAGPLGAGKSTLARALLRVLGVNGPVPSPTYTLIEPYTTRRGPVYHVDLYRLQTEADVRELGLNDMAEEGALTLVEWPEHGAEAALAFDLAVALEYAEPGRRLAAQALTPVGAGALNRLRAAL